GATVCIAVKKGTNHGITETFASSSSSGFVVDGLNRLLTSPRFREKRAAIEIAVRAEHADELAAASDYWRRIAVEEQINREIQRRLDSITPSPYSVWTCW